MQVTQRKTGQGSDGRAIPFYNPELSYEQNYTDGPFGLFADSSREAEPSSSSQIAPQSRLLGLPVALPFGIPAGPLLNGRFVMAALDLGFDLPVYKTVRTRRWSSHAWPNVLAVHTPGGSPPDHQSAAGP